MNSCKLHQIIRRTDRDRNQLIFSEEPKWCILLLYQTNTCICANFGESNCPIAPLWLRAWNRLSSLPTFCKTSVETKYKIDWLVVSHDSMMGRKQCKKRSREDVTNFSENQTKWKLKFERTDQCKQRLSFCHIGLVKDQTSSGQPIPFETYPQAWGNNTWT